MIVFWPSTKRRQETLSLDWLLTLFFLFFFSCSCSFSSSSFLFCCCCFFEGRKYIPVCIPCDELLSIEHIVLLWSDLIEARERHFTTRSLRTLFEDAFWDCSLLLLLLLFYCIFGYLKINIFGKL